MKKPLFTNISLIILTVLLLMFFALSFYGCGKKANPIAPRAVSSPSHGLYKNAQGWLDS